jgi:hypothetical protein
MMPTAWMVRRLAAEKVLFMGLGYPSIRQGKILSHHKL